MSDVKFLLLSLPLGASLVAQMVKNHPAMQETWAQSLGQEDPPKEEMATYSSILAWRIPWTEEPSGLKSMGLQRVRHGWVTNTFTFSHFKDHFSCLISFKSNFPVSLGSSELHHIASVNYLFVSISQSVYFACNWENKFSNTFYDFQTLHKHPKDISSKKYRTPKYPDTQPDSLGSAIWSLN